VTGTKLYWIEGPWAGKLALAARPRGGEWLDDEMAAWQTSGVNVVLSLLTKDEEAELELEQEAKQATAHGMEFLSFPIPDLQVPDSESRLAKTLDLLNTELGTGKNAVVHCRQGIGRTGLVAACLLVSKGMDPATGVERLSAARGLRVPETPEQRRWIEHYAAILANAR
jgi:protein-tyrosine phosphatase